MKYLIVGLGNIGPEYADSRHNIGFMVADQIAAENKTEFEVGKAAFRATIKHKSRTLELVKPTTFMNLSGKAVGHWQSILKIPKENILVITDDIALPFGKIRMRLKGSHGGHNGLRDIETVLGDNEFCRLRFGVGSDFGRGRQADYVLGNFPPDEAAELPVLIEKMAKAVYAFCTLGPGYAMNIYNTKG